MAKSISSDEIFGKASLGTPAPVVHTDPDHRKCAYYIPDSPHQSAPMCEHGHLAFGGGYYSEDFVKGQLFPLIHQFIGQFSDHLAPNDTEVDALVEQLRELTR